MRTFLEVGDSVSCLLGKVSIRQPMKGKVSIKHSFNKSAWNLLSSSDQDEWFVDRGIVTRGVVAGRVVLGRGDCAGVGMRGRKTAQRSGDHSVLVSKIDRRGGISYDM